MKCARFQKCLSSPLCEVSICHPLYENIGLVKLWLLRRHTQLWHFRRHISSETRQRRIAVMSVCVDLVLEEPAPNAFQLQWYLAHKKLPRPQPPPPGGVVFPKLIN